MGRTAWGLDAVSLLFWALWGLAGAIGYGGPRLLVQLFDPPEAKPRPGKATSEFILTLFMGSVGAAGLGPVLAVDFFGTTEAQCRASALVIGLVVNPVAPAAVELFSNVVLRRMGHPGLPGKKRTP